MQNNINILTELRETGSTVLLNTDRENLYSVPADYFNNFTQNLLSRIFIESIPQINPYTVPAGYFDNLSEIILEQLSVRKDFPGINGLEKYPYSVPDGYFDNLAKNVLKKIKTETKTVQQELEEIGPLLSTISKRNVYSVPPGYFNQLNPLKKETERPAAKIVSMGSKSRLWANYAAAACVAAVLLAGAYLFFSNPENPNSHTQSTAGVNVQKSLSELTDSEIANYLNEDNSTAIYTSQGTDEQRDLDINTLLENMSDEEIEQYLNNNADPGEEKGGI